MAAKKETERLKEKINKLEAVITMLCHYSGHDHILKKFKIEPWKPDKKNMSRWGGK